jgi:hypothetical protein
MTTNFQPHSLTTYPGLKQRYQLARTEHYEANARRLVEMCLTNLADGQKEKGQGNLYTSDNTPASNETKTEADNAVSYIKNPSSS